MAPTNLWLRFSSALKFTVGVLTYSRRAGAHPPFCVGESVQVLGPRALDGGQHALRGTKCPVACRLHMHIKYLLFCSKKHYLKLLK